MRESNAVVVRKLDQALEQAKLAYEFSPNSYTYGSLNALIAAHREFRKIETGAA